VHGKTARVGPYEVLVIAVGAKSTSFEMTLVG